MHLLSLFPQLLFLTPFAPFFIRLSIGFLFFLFGLKAISSKYIQDQTASIVALILSFFLILGVWIQACAVVSVLFLIYLAITKRDSYPPSTLFLLIIMSLTLVFTGAGVLAFDLAI